MIELLKMSAYAIPLIWAVIILRALFINRLPKSTFLILWAVVLCRLLIPITLPSPMSVYSLANRLPAPEDIVPTVVWFEDSTGGAALPQAQQGAVSLVETSLNAEQVPVREVGPEANPVSLRTLLTIFWASGVAGCAGFFIITHLRCRRVYRAALPLDNAFVTEWLRACPLKRKVRVRQSDQIHAPLTYGVWRPVILLPKSVNHGDKDRLLYVLAHEETHIRHFDVLWKWLLAATACVHWFNPFVWAMYALAGRDIELCCDEAVVRSLGGTIRSAYAMALIGLEETRSRFTPFCNNFSKTAIEERIISIMKYKRTTVTALLLAVVLIMGTTVAFAFGAAEPQPREAVSANPSTAYAAAIENAVPDYSKYEAYGVTYDAAADALYYHGQLIRCFDDEYPIGDFGTVGINHYTKGGVIDVHAVRDLSQPVRSADGSYDPGGILIGVAPYSQAEFEARRLDEPNAAPSYTAIAEGSTSISPEELAREYSVYEPFGITYDKENDLLYYRGKLIYYFLDVLSSNGEGFSSGKFQGAMRCKTQEYGVISVQVIRDYNDLDANGYGKIIGIETIVEEHLDSIWMEANDLQQSIAPYAPYGLSQDASTNTMWYKGRQVRELYDPITGVLVTSSLGDHYPADAIDIVPVYENGVLTGLRQATQAEYDRRTEERRQRIEWWTAEEYAEWLEEEKIGLRQIIGERAWNNADGWFIWTREKVDDTIRMYEQTLEDIKRGAKVSKTIVEAEAIVIEGVEDTTVSIQETFSAISASNDALVASVSENVVAEVTENAGGFSAVIPLSDGTAVDLGTFSTYVERYKAVEAFCERQVAGGAMTQAEAETIIRQYM